MSCREYKTKSVRGGLREQSGIDKMNETAWHIWLNENWNWTDGQEPRRSFVVEYNFELPSMMLFLRMLKTKPMLPTVRDINF